MLSDDNIDRENVNNVVGYLKRMGRVYAKAGAKMCIILLNYVCYGLTMELRELGCVFALILKWKFLYTDRLFSSCNKTNSARRSLCERATRVNNRFRTLCCKAG